jgi:hypothetical protein
MRADLEWLEDTGRAIRVNVQIGRHEPIPGGSTVAIKVFDVEFDRPDIR